MGLMPKKSEPIPDSADFESKAEISRFDALSISVDAMSVELIAVADNLRELIAHLREEASGIPIANASLQESVRIGKEENHLDLKTDRFARKHLTMEFRRGVLWVSWDSWDVPEEGGEKRLKRNTLVVPPANIRQMVPLDPPKEPEPNMPTNIPPGMMPGETEGEMVPASTGPRPGLIPTTGSG